MFRFFSKYKKLVYTCFGHEQYFKIIGNLQFSGVPYRTESRMGFSNFGSSSQGSEMAQYDIYVKGEDEGRALQAIHHQDR